MGIIYISNVSGTGYTVPGGTIIMMPTKTTPDPDGFTYYSAINDYYIVPVSSGSGATGGSATHTHTQTLSTITAAGAHTHTSTGTSGQCSSSEDYHKYGTSVSVASSNHTHSWSIETGSGGSHTHALSGSAPVQSGSALTNPAFRSLVGYKANTGGASLPDEAIIMWYGGTPPDKFKLCDGTHSPVDMRNYFLKLSSTSGSAGSNSAHTHTVGELASSGAHEHSVAGSVNGSGAISTNGQDPYNEHGVGSHGNSIASFNTTGGSEADHNHSSFNSNSGTNDCPCVYLYFIQYQK